MAKLNVRTGIRSNSRAGGLSRVSRPSASDVRAANQSFRNAAANANLRSPWFTRTNRTYRQVRKQSEYLRELKRGLAPLRGRTGWIGDLIDIAYYYDDLAYPGIASVNNPAWTLAATCPGITPTYMTHSTASTVPVPTCLVNVYPGPVMQQPFTTDPAPTMRSAYTWQYNQCVPGGAGVPWGSCADIGRRYSRSEVYLFPASPGRLVRNIWAPAPRYLPNPALDPALLPINQPSPLPRPLSRPMRQAAEKRNERQYGLGRPRVRPNPLARPSVSNDPLITEGMFPYPGARIELAPKPRLLPGVHRFRPPPRGTKERKFILYPASNSAIGLLMNAVSETDDFVTSLYYAVPPRFRSDHSKKAPAGLHEKMAIVYRHFDKINVGYAINNLIDNQIEDFVYGKMGRLQAKANRKLGLSTGPNLQLPR